MSESEIQKQIIDALKLSGHLLFRMNAGKAANNIRLCPKGTPDLLAISRGGKTTWIEVKTPSGALRPAQKEMIADLESRGQRVIVARSLDDIAGKLF